MYTLDIISIDLSLTDVRQSYENLKSSKYIVTCERMLLPKSAQCVFLYTYFFYFHCDRQKQYLQDEIHL